MSLNKSRGQMYPWTTHTWNPIRGKCPHGCTYCFMRGRDVGALRLDEKALADNLGTGRVIFVGSSTDMWAVAVPHDWILRVLEKCNSYINTYLFQSKDPARFMHTSCGVDIKAKFPLHTVLATTLETNRDYGHGVYHGGHAPPPYVRAAGLAHEHLNGFVKMVSIEPVMAFDLEPMLRWVQQIKPQFVTIGADSKGHNLPEPTVGELDMLIVGLRKFTEVKLKSNLGRLLGREIKEG